MRNNISSPPSWRVLLTLPAKLVTHYAPGWAAASILLACVQGIIPLCWLAVLRMTVDQMVHPQSSSLPMLFPGLGLLLLLQLACRSIGEYVQERLSHKITDGMMDVIHQQSTCLDLADHEDPHIHDMLHRALTDAPARPAQFVQHVTQVCQYSITLVGCASVLVTLVGAPILLVLVLAVPVLLARWHFQLQEHHHRASLTTLQRHA